MADVVLEHLAVEWSVDGAGRRVVTLSGDVDMAAAPQIRRIHQLVQADEPVQVDLEGVGFADLIGLDLLLGLRRSRGHVTFVHASPAVHRLLELAGLPDLTVDVEVV